MYFDQTNVAVEMSQSRRIKLKLTSCNQYAIKSVKKTDLDMLKYVFSSVEDVSCFTCKLLCILLSIFQTLRDGLMLETG